MRGARNTFPAFCPPSRCGRQGFSLSEMVITISLLGILSGVAMVSLHSGFSASQETLALDRLETVNRAVHQYSVSNTELVFNAKADSAADEIYLLRKLQYRNPNEAKAAVGSPYLPPNYNPAISSTATEFRLRWNGRLFELLRPGQNGTGLKVAFDGSDMTQPFVFPPNF